MKLKTELLLLVFVLLLAGKISIAQEEKSNFSLEEAIQYATENSYVLKNSINDITISQKKVWETISIGLPQVSGTANYNAFLNLPVTLLPGEFFGQPPGTYVPEVGRSHVVL